MSDKVELNQRVARRIFEFREASGWTQADLAKAVGGTRGQVYRMETNQQPLKLPDLEKYCAVMNIAPSQLLAEVEPVIEPRPIPEPEQPKRANYDLSRNALACARAIDQGDFESALNLLAAEMRARKGADGL